jgi:hypothetical protein
MKLCVRVKKTNGLTPQMARFIHDSLPQKQKERYTLPVLEHYQKLIRKYSLLMEITLMVIRRLKALKAQALLAAQNAQEELQNIPDENNNS